MSCISKGWRAYQKSMSAGKEHAREALDLFAAAAEALREAGDEDNLPLALDGLGAALHLLGTREDLLRADKCYEEEMKLHEAAGNCNELVQAVSSRQAVMRDLAVLDPGSAFAYLERGLKLGDAGMTLAAKGRDERALAWVSLTTADLCCVLARADPSRAASHLETAIDLYGKSGVLWDRAASRRSNEPAAEVSERSVPPIKGAVEAAGPRPRGDGGEAAEGKVLSLLGMAEACIMRGTGLDEARILLDRVREFYSKAGPVPYRMGHLESLYGSLALAERDLDRARRHFERAAGIFRRLGFTPDRGGDVWKQGT